MDLFSQPSFINEPQIKKFNLPDADITLYENLFSNKESLELYHSLLKNIEWQQDKIKFYGKNIDLPRLTAWYGSAGNSYTYSGIPMNPLPWNKDLLFIKNRIETLSGVEFSSVLLNQYRNGKDSVSWHQDNEKELGVNPIIGSVSFGEARPFQLKHLDLDIPKVDIPLTNGSFLLMKGTTQHYWKHQIPKTTKQLDIRINLTFRIIK